jgi:hypothetical protein
MVHLSTLENHFVLIVFMPMIKSDIEIKLKKDQFIKTHMLFCTFVIIFIALVI